MVYEGLIMVAPGVIAAGISAAGMLGSAGVNAASASVSNYRQYNYQKKLQSHAAQLNYDYSKKYNKYSLLSNPTYTRQGYESAGYNPMLAVQNSTSGSNASFTSAGQASAPDYVNAINTGIANAQSFQRLKNETKQAESQAKMNDATAENQNSQAINNLEENKWISPKRKAEIANLEGDTMLKEAQIDNLSKQIELGYAGLTLQRELGFAGITVQQDANAIQSEKNEIERKGNPFRTVRDFGDKYNWSPRQFGEELGRRYFRDHFGPSRRYR